jgi:MraZ protein
VALFFDCHVHKIDRKGRVSVPAQFRAALMSQTFSGIVAFPSFSLRDNFEAIEACGIDRMDMLGDSLDQLDLYSEERDDLAASIFGNAVQLPFDGDGRIMLPDRLLEHAGIADQAAFVGGGRTFQIWSPASYSDFAKEAPTRARDARAKLRLGPPGGEGREQ